MKNAVTNSIGRRIPEKAEGLGRFRPFGGSFALIDAGEETPRNAPPLRPEPPSRSKVRKSLREAVERSGLQSGMTVSFHHHLRNGDALLPMVLSELEAMGMSDLTIAPSSLTGSHDCVAGFIRRGVVSRIFTSGLRGEVGAAVSRGELDIPVIIRSHGGRARAIEEGSIDIDVAFLAAPSCDPLGNISGARGKSGCGSLGYARVDAAFARHVIAVTDGMEKYPLPEPVSIRQHQVNSVVVVESLGDPSKIATGSTRITRNPVDLRIARNAFELILASELLAPGASFQVGAGGSSLAVASFVRNHMKTKGVKGSFGLGGVTGYMVQMLEEGLFDCLYDVQSFDASVRDSLAENPRHVEIDQSLYANPLNRGCMVHNLDIVVLAALDVDVDFNVNVMTGNDGVLRGASGGHSDTAAGAALSIVVAPSFRGGVPTVKERVQTVVTPGESVDAIVTERGICVNPRREALLKAASKAGLPVMDIADLKRDVERLTGLPEPLTFDEKRPVALVEYRDGTIIDTVYRVK
ncbi:MAG: citrate lyase subunit alpha [Synergistota bacterium]|nr:citrate lyase subunit alpha [Synergistota bacterium]